VSIRAPAHGHALRLLRQSCRPVPVGTSPGRLPARRAEQGSCDHPGRLDGPDAREGRIVDGARATDAELRRILTEPERCLEAERRQAAVDANYLRVLATTLPEPERSAVLAIADRIEPR
jgi:hypothetical protein